MNLPMIPVVDSNMSYAKPNVTWLSLEDIHYVVIANKETGKFEYHTGTGIYYSITRVDDLGEALEQFNLTVSNRGIIVNPEHATDYDKELRMLKFPDGSVPVAVSHERKIKRLIS
ncbi:LytTR family transcriptional regulator DNA-binding domain-containing protein [Paenibacillus sp. JSM ZJ436]|uniref:LytTR family transcriptional regulator DNA-binding domain-containing protein n=1 Tax=Paenibacillus sp. JSM ZJ436 TaxID=3376190 RepID=UPI003793CD32